MSVCLCACVCGCGCARGCVCARVCDSTRHAPRRALLPVASHGSKRERGSHRGSHTHPCSLSVPELARHVEGGGAALGMSPVDIDAAFQKLLHVVHVAVVRRVVELRHWRQWATQPRGPPNLDPR